MKSSGFSGALRAAVFAIATLIFSVTAARAAVQMEKIDYQGWPNSIRLTNGRIELVATTDVGPRVMRLGFVGGQNILKEYKDQLGRNGDKVWNIYGGHRLWHAPEDAVRTYALDNSPIKHEWDGRALKLIQPTESITGLEKQIEITLSADSDKIELVHRLINHNLWAVELSPWCLTVMAQGGRAIFPQEPYGPHPKFLLPARPLVLWPYTQMADPRWTWSDRYIQLRQDAAAKTPQKVGLLNRQGWAAYALGGDVFVKRYPFDETADYPDFDVNTETFTNADMIEVETLGPLTALQPGAAVVHVEHWYLFKADLGKTDDELDATLRPLVEKTRPIETSGDRQ